MATHASSTPAPARHRRRPWHQYRPEIEALIERLVTILDEVDGDPDLEPSLAAPERHPTPYHSLADLYPSMIDQRLWTISATDDREDDAGDDVEEPGAQMYDGWPEPDVVRVRRASR